MDAYELEYNQSEFNAIVDPFDNVEYDPFTQTGGDWYRLMLSATHGGAVIHGQTMAPTCETLAKVDEAFAQRHATARIHIDKSTKDTDHADESWQLQNLKGKAYHGSRTANKARMLFDTAEWEPSTRVRAANAAFVGGLLAAQGCTLADSTMIASAIAGEQIPQEAITNTELPLSVLKHEAASAAKQNHVVYSYGNTQNAIRWDMHQFHDQTLPADASLDWSRITTLARYLGEANSMVDEKFSEYASVYGVPYSIVKGSWASVWAADYILDVDKFRDVPLADTAKLPTPPLADAYDKQANNMYDAIHRMANEVKVGLTDITLESLLKIAETYRGKKKGRLAAAGTELLADTSMHMYTADDAANNVKTAARSWDALTCAVTELVSSNRQLKQACASAVANYKSRMEYLPSLEPLMLELCAVPVWLRAFDYLKTALGNHYKARERMSKLKRTTLANSAPLETAAILTQRARTSMSGSTMRLATLALTGKMPMNRMSVDARRVMAHQNMDQQAVLYNSVNQHLHKSKREWSKRYSQMAETYALAQDKQHQTKSVLYGTAAKAFSMVNAYLLTRSADGFIDPQDLNTSYVLSSAKNYIRKRNISQPNFKPLEGLTAQEQALWLDQNIRSKVSFSEIVEFCEKRLMEFYTDIANGIEPPPPQVDTPPCGESPVFVSPPMPIDTSVLESMFAEFDKPAHNLYQAVLNSYVSENQADAHARANKYGDFLEAFEKLGDRARYDTETQYTQTGVRAAMLAEESLTSAFDAPVI